MNRVGKILLATALVVISLFVINHFYYNSISYGDYTISGTNLPLVVELESETPLTIVFEKRFWLPVKEPKTTWEIVEGNGVITEDGAFMATALGHVTLEVEVHNPIRWFNDYYLETYRQEIYVHNPNAQGLQEIATDKHYSDEWIHEVCVGLSCNDDETSFWAINKDYIYITKDQGLIYRPKNGVVVESIKKGVITLNWEEKTDEKEIYAYLGGTDNAVREGKDWRKIYCYTPYMQQINLKGEIISDIVVGKEYCDYQGYW